MSEEKTPGKLLQEKLTISLKHGSLRLSAEKLDEVARYCEGYKTFLDNAKTEREAITTAIAMAEAKGFRPFEPGKKYLPGDKVYLNNRGKSAIFATVGKEPLSQGVRIMAAHVDSPRIDLKPTPVYEDSELALLKTHYYGGIKKYQWTALPLALHGVVILQDGTPVTVSVGEDEADPIFVITDLLPHMAADQMKRTLSDGIRGEELNVLAGSYAYPDDTLSERVKLNLLRILNEKYGIIEADLLSAELSLVPVHRARDIGFDRGMIGAYGQDDRVCGYTALTALLDTEDPTHTVLCVLADKEEIGSDGNTGLNSSYLPYFVADLAKPHGLEGREVLSRSKCLSADVTAGFDPTFPEVHERRNATFVNYGVAVTKYTGARGKAGTSDASAEYTAWVEHLLDRHGVLWQTGELGRVDQGGGGTVAMYIANLDVDVIDIGVPVLSMHAPLEVTGKIDVYSAYQAFRAFAAS